MPDMYVSVHKYIYIYVYIYVYIYICIYIHMYIMCIYIYTHTHISMYLGTSLQGGEQGGGESGQNVLGRVLVLKARKHSPAICSRRPIVSLGADVTWNSGADLWDFRAIYGLFDESRPLLWPRRRSSSPRRSQRPRTSKPGEVLAEAVRPVSKF